MDTENALRLLLDHVDYTAGACGPAEMVGAVLPRDVIRLCREAVALAAAERAGQAGA